MLLVVFHEITEHWLLILSLITMITKAVTSRKLMPITTGEYHIFMTAVVSDISRKDNNRIQKDKYADDVFLTEHAYSQLILACNKTIYT